MRKKFTNAEYNKYVEDVTPKSKKLSNIVKAFAVGGVICVTGQFINNLLSMRGFSDDTSSSITTLIMIFLGALFTGLNIYDELGRYAGGGSIVPITGFANSIVSPAMEHRSEGFITGVGARMFVIAGPVLVYGVLSSVVIGIVYYLLRY
jgi:stage V sporulation protein AC